MVPPLVSRECFGRRHRQIDQHQIIGLLTRWSGRLAKYINSPRSVWTWKSASVISKCTDRSYSDNTGQGLPERLPPHRYAAANSMPEPLAQPIVGMRIDYLIGQCRVVLAKSEAYSQ